MKISAWQKFRSDKWGIAALAVILIYLAAAFSVEIYDLYCRNTGRTPAYSQSSAKSYQPPSSEHWCGTDYQGRDVFCRMVAGTSGALKTGLFSGIIAVSIGVTLGMISGYCGGRIDEITVWLFSTFASMPTLLFILAFALLMGQDFLSSR